MAIKLKTTYPDYKLDFNIITIVIMRSSCSQNANFTQNSKMKIPVVD